MGVEMAKLLGADREKAKSEMKNALLFQIKLAQTSTSRDLRRDPTSMYTPMKLKEMRNSFDTDMKDYLNQLFVAANAGDIQLEDDEKIINVDPTYLEKLPTVLNSTKNRTIANYLGWTLLESLVLKLNNAARNIKQDFDRD